jgi:predicted transcriptional regulator
VRRSEGRLAGGWRVRLRPPAVDSRSRVGEPKYGGLTVSDSESSHPDGTLLVPPRHVGDLVGRRPIAVVTGSTLRATIAKLVDNDVGVVLITDGDKTRGIISERDLIDSVHEGSDLDAEVVDDIMQPELITIDPMATVVDAGRMMIERGVRHVVVEGPEGGVVSIRAVLRSIVT